MLNKQKLGEILVGQNIVTKDDVDYALELQKEAGGLLGSILIRLGMISEQQLLPILSEQLQIPVINNSHLPFSAVSTLEWLVEITGYRVDWWLDNQIFAWPLTHLTHQLTDSSGDKQSNAIMVIAKDVFNRLNAEILFSAFPGFDIRWALAPSHLVDTFFSQLEGAVENQKGGGVGKNLKELAEEAPVIEYVNNLLSQAVEQNASDIHLEPQELIFEVRYRVDGGLLKKFRQPREKFDAIASRIKLISNIDIAESRLPQDGRIKTKASGMEFDIRVSTVPGSFGESIVMRLLPTEKANIGFSALGFDAAQTALFKSWVQQPHGIVLVTGPTGSGKSTTLYTALDHINDGNKKIITVEDPVEYQISGLTQVQTQPEIGLTFASALRAFLRQDPDVMMVGEIRDVETAEIAIQSSLTGHLVVSTLHTNDAVSAFTRLTDMGIDRFLVATPIIAVMAQRLLRKVCTSCCEGDSDVFEQYEILANEKGNIARPHWVKAGKGCEHCNGSGYKGRLGIYEMINVCKELQAGILDGLDNGQLWEIAKRSGTNSLREDGILKAARGLTTIEEVLRVTGEQ